MTVSELKRLCEIGESLGQGDSAVCMTDEPDTQKQSEPQVDYVKNCHPDYFAGTFVLRFCYANQ